MMATMINKNIFVVMVTYGSREHLLKQAIKSLDKQDISKVIVVNNGSEWPVKIELENCYNDWIYVVENKTNTGSAIGFSMGIQRAIDLGAEYLWLLDDDNKPQFDAQKQLIETHREAARLTPREHLVIAAYRPEQYPLKNTSDHIKIRNNSFLGFHLIDAPIKIFRLIPWTKLLQTKKTYDLIWLDSAPYGGSYFHRELIHTIGLPNCDFILYADDLEYFYRVTQKSGKILLTRNAIVEDLNPSWDDKKRFRFSLFAHLNGDNDLRAYYIIRNTVYFEFNILNNKKAIFLLNRIIYTHILFIFSFILKKRKRYHLISRAIDDGIKGKIGLDDDFPLA